MKFYQQQREQAKKKTDDIDGYKVGHAAGFDVGFDAGVQAVLRQLTDEGVIDADDAPGEAAEDE